MLLPKWAPPRIDRELCKWPFASCPLSARYICSIAQCSSISTIDFVCPSSWLTSALYSYTVLAQYNCLKHFFFMYVTSNCSTCDSWEIFQWLIAYILKGGQHHPRLLRNIWNKSACFFLLIGREPSVPVYRTKDPRCMLCFCWSKKDSRCNIWSYWSKWKTF